MSDLNPDITTKGKVFAQRTLMLWVLLFMFTFPLDHFFIGDAGQVVMPLFEGWVKWEMGWIYEQASQPGSAIVSDAIALYLHMANLLLLSVLGAFVWGVVAGYTVSRRLLYWFRVMVAYYLGWMMLYYGFNKVFKYQFYLPEPNILYTDVGQTPRDLLYWSAMGTSYFYTVFMGITEVVAGMLLFFRRTRLTGALLTFMIMLNVVMINLGFDINVKVFSIFLWMLSLVLIGPHLSRLWQFLSGKAVEHSASYKPDWAVAKKVWVYRMAKMAVIALIVVDCLVVYALKGNFNDDVAPRPLYHGAYAVKEDMSNIVAIPTQASGWKRLFIHRQGYLIFQDYADQMFDFELTYAANGDSLLIHDYYRDIEAGGFAVRSADGRLTGLQGSFYGDSMKLELDYLPADSLPLLQNEFGWTIER